MSRRRPPAENSEISHPTEDTLLGWTDMAHYRKPREPPPELPSAIVIRLMAALEDAMVLCRTGAINRRIAATMLQALHPVVKREQLWQQQHLDEPHFTAEDHKLADHILNLLTFGNQSKVGYSRTQISAFLKHNRTSGEITVALSILRRSARAVMHKARTSGTAKREVWRLTRDGDFKYPLPPKDAGLPPKPVGINVGDDRPARAPRPVWGEDIAYREYREAAAAKARRSAE